MSQLSVNRCIGLVLVLLSAPATGGPNWEAIEAARTAQQLKKQEIAQAETAQRGIRERLEHACNRVKGKDEELEAICQEILSAYQSSQDKLGPGGQ